ncbi:hypothetical protein AB6A40_004142 [Gnathostoma spinigerum]|uniref:Uncharacterized protein n=1 Tax=Gnathostoma spinigerum TaxID=75299 RepID=A0ABD6EBS9_9BILA
MEQSILTVFLLVLQRLSLSTASFCGSAGVPFSFEVLPSGAPVLGCAQPSCLATPADFKEDKVFLANAEGQTDGFFRSGDRELARYRDQSAKKITAKCPNKFAELSCPKKDQWVGGIEYIDHPRQPLILQCCTFEGLRVSQDVGVTNVGPGEAITGGEVVRDGRQISFDVIANVRKVVNSNSHKISYEVTVRRMNCLPDPPEPKVDLDPGVSKDVLRILTKASDGIHDSDEKRTAKSDDKAFAAPTLKIDEHKNKKIDKDEKTSVPVTIIQNKNQIPLSAPGIANTQQYYQQTQQQVPQQQQTWGQVSPTSLYTQLAISNPGQPAQSAAAATSVFGVNPQTGQLGTVVQQQQGQAAVVNTAPNNQRTPYFGQPGFNALNQNVYGHQPSQWQVTPLPAFFTIFPTFPSQNFAPIGVVSQQRPQSFASPLLVPQQQQQQKTQAQQSSFPFYSPQASIDANPTYLPQQSQLVSQPQVALLSNVASNYHGSAAAPKYSAQGTPNTNAGPAVEPAAGKPVASAAATSTAVAAPAIVTSAPLLPATTQPVNTLPTLPSFPTAEEFMQMLTNPLKKQLDELFPKNPSITPLGR